MKRISEFEMAGISGGGLWEEVKGYFKRLWKQMTRGHSI